MHWRHELTPGSAEWAGDLRKFAPVFPAHRELEDQARSGLRGPPDMIRTTEAPRAGVARMRAPACAGPVAMAIRRHDQANFNRPPFQPPFGEAGGPRGAAEDGAQGQSAPPQGSGAGACRRSRGDGLRY